MGQCVAKKKAYAVVIKMGFQNLKGLIQADREVAHHLDSMVQLQLLYLGDNKSQAETYAKEIVEYHSQSSHLSKLDLDVKSIDLIQTVFNRSFEEGILNEHIIWSWNPSTGLTFDPKENYHNRKDALLLHWSV